jgi:ParB-like chromosome segregation protein Spo0J
MSLQQKTKQSLTEVFEESDSPVEALNSILAALTELHPFKDQPVALMKWVPIDKVEANDYNPNSVAKNEMRLLYVSIDHDGYTQPVVTVYDEERDKYVIVDGFHRYSTMRLNEDIQEKTGGYLPVVVIDKPLKDRMASTIRHNRARGKHSVAGMANMVYSMLEEGMSDEEVCAELGMEADEIIRLKHVTGFSKLFENVEYRKSWESKRQIKLRLKREAEGVRTPNQVEL